MAFQDHFSQQAAGYATYRPHYPKTLYAWLAGLVDEHEAAWDCATGNGQAAHGLAPYFKHIWATDGSSSQIEYAVPHATITYRVATADASGMPAQSVSLVTVAQAIHWFNHEQFYTEVRRVLKPQGVLAAWTYGLFSCTSDVDEVISHYYDAVIGSYWPPERRLVEKRYQTIPFPFEEIEAPAFHIEVQWDLADVIGYLGTWSATQRFKVAKRKDPVAQIIEPLATAWGPAQTKRTIRWPLYLRVGRL